VVKNGEGMLMVTMSVGSQRQNVSLKIDLESDEVMVYSKTGSKMSNGFDFKRSKTFIQGSLTRNVTVEVDQILSGI
jgi:hypothetical protein